MMLIKSIIMISYSFSPFSIKQFNHLLLIIIILHCFTIKLNHCQPINSLELSDPDEDRTCGEFITSRGFNFEDHYVTTEDGYILHLFRIINPYAQQSLGHENLEPVLMQHGLSHSATSYLFNSPGGDIIPWVNGKPPNVTGNNLGFVLANRGYDVWLGACRGDTYSKNHTHHDSSDREGPFWFFTVDEIAKYDTTAEIDYILKVTNKESLAYIGHSQGSLQMLLLLSIKPSYSEKVKPVILLAPASFFGHVRGTYAVIPYNPALNEFARLYPSPMMSPGPATVKFFETICSNPVTAELCTKSLNQFAGPDSPQLNQSRVSVYIEQGSWTSWSNFYNYIKYREDNHPRFYDYGPALNLIKYGSMIPPHYPYHNINSTCLALISGLNDYAVDQRDVQQLRNNLTVKPLADYIIPYSDWNHMDFIYAKESYKYLTPIILSVLQEKCQKNLNHKNINIDWKIIEHNWLD